MNLVYRYFELGIEGMPSGILKQIFEGTHNIKVKVANNGMIMLSNNRIVKCVKDYYRTKDNSQIVLKKVSNQCFYVQNSLDITGVSNYRCAECHLHCMQMQKEGKLIRG